MRATTRTKAKPVAIFAHPELAEPEHVMMMARYAVAEQMIPVVLHPIFMPWYDEEHGLHAAAGDHARELLAMVARHTGGQLWVLLQPGERLLDKSAPMWTLGATRAWRRHGGRSPMRLRHGDPAVWLQLCRAKGVADV